MPAGGHVEMDEDPKETVIRECFEELKIQPDFWRKNPVFLTSTVTVGLTAGHTDVSLWYVLKGRYQNNYVFDHDEFNAIRWFDFDNIPLGNSELHLLRFINKLRTLL